MRSQKAWEYIETLLDKDFNGNVDPAKFVIFFNAAQIEYMYFMLGNMRDYQPGQTVSSNSPEASGRAMDAVAPFWKKRFPVPVTNGRANIYTTGPSSDFMGQEKLFLPGFENPACGQQPLSRWEVPFTRMPASEWPWKSNPKHFCHPTLEFPSYMMIENGDALILPLEVNSLWATYLRAPRPITIALLPGGEVDQAANNDDPEWNDMDTIDIMHGVAFKCGVREQAPSWMQAATAMRRNL